MNLFNRQPSLRNSSFRITEGGRSKLQEDFSSGDPKTRILIALETTQGGSMEDISQASRMSRGQIERLLPIMVRQGLIAANDGSSGDL